MELHRQSQYDRFNPPPDYDAISMALVLFASGLQVWVDSDELLKSIQYPSVVLTFTGEPTLRAFNGWYYRRVNWGGVMVSRMNRPGVLTGRVGGVVGVECAGYLGVAWSDRRLPPTPMTLRESGGRIGESTRDPKVLRLYRCPDTATTSIQLFGTGSCVQNGRVYGDRDLVRIPTFLADGDRQTAALDQVSTWPHISDLPVFDPAWIAGVR